MHLFISFFQTLAGTRLKDFEKQRMFKQALPRLAAFVLQGLQRPIRLRDGCDEFVKKRGDGRDARQPANMAGDFTQEQSLTRHCHQTCHLRQTRQLTRMQLGIGADQFPECQRDTALIVAFCEVKKNPEKIKTQVQLVRICLDILSTLCSQHRPAASQDAQVSKSVPQISNYGVGLMLLKLLQRRSYRASLASHMCRPTPTHSSVTGDLRPPF